MKKKKKQPELVAVIHKKGARGIGHIVKDSEFFYTYIPIGSGNPIELWKNHITVLRILHGKL